MLEWCNSDATLKISSLLFQKEFRNVWKGNYFLSCFCLFVFFFLDDFAYFLFCYGDSWSYNYKEIVKEVSTIKGKLFLRRVYLLKGKIKCYKTTCLCNGNTYNWRSKGNLVHTNSSVNKQAIILVIILILHYTCHPWDFRN